MSNTISLQFAKGKAVFQKERSVVRSFPQYFYPLEPLVEAAAGAESDLYKLRIISELLKAQGKVLVLPLQFLLWSMKVWP